MPPSAPSDFERLALPLLDEIHQAALFLSHRDHEAQDLVQECYLRAWKSFHRFQPGTNLRAWLLTILRNAHIDQCRRKGLEPVRFDPEEGPDMEQFSAPPAAPPLPEELRAALESLPPKDRILIFLCDVEGFSYREIAQILDCPMGSVMSGLFHARQRLRERLKRAPGGDPTTPRPLR